MDFEKMIELQPARHRDLSGESLLHVRRARVRVADERGRVALALAHIADQQLVEILGSGIRSTPKISTNY